MRQAWVDNGRMKPAKARSEIDAMEAVLATLIDLAQNQEFKLT